MVYTLRFFFSSKSSSSHNSKVFGSCIIHILYTGCAKKIIPASKVNCVSSQRHLQISPWAAYAWNNAPVKPRERYSTHHESILHYSHFWVGSQNCGKLLLGSSCLFVCLSVCLYLSIRPSVRTEQLGSHWMDFHEIWHVSTFRKNLSVRFTFG